MARLTDDELGALVDAEIRSAIGLGGGKLAEQRRKAESYFYGLPEGLISRFYAGNSHVFDKLRILSGKPPVPVGEALRAALRCSPRHFEKHS